MTRDNTKSVEKDSQDRQIRSGASGSGLRNGPRQYLGQEAGQGCLYHRWVVNHLSRVFASALPLVQTSFPFLIFFSTYLFPFSSNGLVFIVLG